MVSIIITSYNRENLIGRAIQSCMAQTYKDIEILVVDDCSTDNSIEVIKDLQKQDSRIKLFINDENLGAGLSRRRGTKEAKGEYTAFLDSDDYYDKYYIETLYNAITLENADMVGSGYHIYDTEGNLIEDRIPEHKVEEGEDIYKSDDQDTKRFLNTKLVKRELWDKVDYSSRRFIEDTPTLLMLMYHCKKTITLNYAGYYYIQNPESLCHSSSQLKHKLYSTLMAKDMREYFIDKDPERCTMHSFMYCLRNLQQVIGVDDIYKYKDEVTEIFEYFLKNTKF